MSIGLLCFIILAAVSVVSCIICFVKEKKRETRRGVYLSFLGIVISLFGIIWTQYPNLFNKDVKELYKSWNIEDEKEIQSDKNIQDHKAWGPDREMIKWGSYFEHPAFNSIENNPYLGDERNFVRIRKADTDDNFSDEVDLEVGSEYEVAIYFHNNGDPALNKSGNVVAENVRLRIEEPEYLHSDSYAVIRGTLTSTNANPREIWDVAYVCADSEVLLQYVPNSAVIHSLGNIDSQVLSSDAMFGEKGVMIGYWNDLWGVVPAGKEYGGYITYRFEVNQG